MTDLFISYAREDQAFVRWLHDALQARGRDVWVDWEDIPLSADWLAEVFAAIETADTFVFVISPDSVTSQVCAQELEHAVQHNKRLVPIVHRDTPSDQVPPALARLNWLLFRQGDDLDQALESLLATIDTDLDWVRAHTRLLVRAIEWDNNEGNRSYLLQGDDLNAALASLSQIGKEPPLTSLQREYILASRQNALRRRRVALTLAILAVVVLAVASLFAWRQRQSALSQELALSAVAQLDVDPELSILLGREGVKAARNEQSVGALRRALAESHVRQVLRGHQDRVLSAAFSPDGQWVVTTSGDKTARIWEAASGELLHELAGHVDWLRGATISQDGRLVVTWGRDNTVRVWDAGSGEMVVVHDEHGDWIDSAVLSPDGELVVSVDGDHVAHLWQASTGSLVAKAGGPAEQIIGAAFSADGQPWIVTSVERTTELQDITSGKTLLRLQGVRLNRAEFSPDGQWMLALDDRQTALASNAVLWRAGERDVVELQGETGLVEQIAFSRDGQWLALAGTGEPIRVWRTSDGSLVSSWRGHANRVTRVAFHPSGSWLLTASEDATAVVWDVTRGQVVAELRGHGDRINNAAFSPDGTLVVTASDDGTARLWEASPGQTGTALAGHTDRVASVEFSHDGRQVVTAGYDVTARVWDVATGAPGATFAGNGGPVLDAAFSPNGDQVVMTGGDATVQVWDVGGERAVAELPGPGGTVTCVAFSPDGQSVALGVSKGLGETGFVAQVWDLASSTPTVMLSGHTGALTDIAFSSDGRQIVTAAVDGTTRVWDVASGQPRQVLSGHAGPVNSARFSPDGDFVVTASSDHTARIWDVATGEAVERLGHSDMVRGASYSGDGRWIVTAGWDAAARLWDAQTGQSIAQFRNASSRLTAVAISPDNRRLALADENGAGIIIPCAVCGSVDELVALIPERVHRDLTCEERRTYLHSNVACP